MIRTKYESNKNVICVRQLCARLRVRANKYSTNWYVRMHATYNNVAGGSMQCCDIAENTNIRLPFTTKTV